MKSTMKSAFAIIAVAMMIMVAVVPMAGVLVSDNPVSADDVDYVTVVVKQNSGTALDDVAVLTDGGTTYKTTNGQVQIPLTTVVNKVLTPAKTGFAFYPASITMNTSTVKAGDTYTFTAFTNQTVVTVTAGGQPVAGVTINAITKTVYDPSTAHTPSWSGTNYTTDANGKVYISMTEAEMYIKVTSTVSNPNGMAGTATYPGETGLKDSAYKLTADKSIAAAETLYTILVKDKAGQAITSTINVGVKDDVATTSPVTATTDSTGQALILFKKSETATKVIATATNASGYTFAATTGVAEKDFGGTTATFNSLETTYTLKVMDKDKRLSLNGSMTVTYTNASQTDISTTATFANGAWTFTVLDDGAVSNITVTLTSGFQDALGNAFTFPGNEATPTANKYVITNPGESLEIVSTDGTITISGNIFYKDGTTKFDKAATVTFGTATVDNTVAEGAYAFYVKSVSDSDSKITLINLGNYTSANTEITLRNVTKDLANMDFILNQSKQVEVKVNVSNGNSITNMTGLTVKADNVTLTWNATSNAYVGELDRDSYTITVGPVASSATASAVTPTVSSGSVTYDLSASSAYAYNEDTVTVTLAPVAISGYISYEVDDVAAKCRPVQDASGTMLTYSVNGGTATQITTKSNGDYGFNGATAVKSYYGEKVLFEYKPTSGTQYYQKTIDTTSQTGTQVTNVIMDGYEYQSVVTGEIYGWKAFVNNTKMYYVSKVTVEYDSQTATLDVDAAGKFNFNIFDNLSAKVQQGKTVEVNIKSITVSTDYGLSSTFTVDSVAVTSNKITVDTQEYIYEGKLVAANGDAPVKGETVEYYDITNGTVAGTKTYTTTATNDNGRFYFFVTAANVNADTLYLVKSTNTSGGYEYSSYFRVQTTKADTPAASTITSGYLTNTIAPASYVPKWDGTLHSIDYCISGTAKDVFGANVVTNTLQYTAGATAAANLAIDDGKFYIGRIASTVTSLTFSEEAAGTYGMVSGANNWKTQATLALTTEKGVLAISVTEAKNSYSSTGLTTGELKTITPTTVKIDDVTVTGTYYAKIGSKVEVTLSSQYMDEVLTATVSSATLSLKSSYVTFTFKVPYLDSPSTYYGGKVKIDGTETASDIVGSEVKMILKANAKHTVSYDWNGNGYTILNSKDNLSNEDAKLITVQTIDMSRHVFKVTYTDASGQYAISGADMNVYVKNDITKANYVNTFVTDDNGQFYLDADLYNKIVSGTNYGIFLFTPFGDLYSLEYKKYVDLGSAFPANEGSNYTITAKAKEVRAVYDFTGYYDHKAVAGLDVTFSYTVSGAAITDIVLDRTTDDNGRITLDAIPASTEITVSSAGYVFIAADDREIATEMDDTITASNYAVELLTGEYAIVGAVNYMSSKGELTPVENDWIYVNGTDEVDKIETGKDGGFALTDLETSYVFKKPGFTAVTLPNTGDANIVNVGGVITFDLGTIVLDYKEMKGTVKVKNSASFVGVDKDLATINGSKITVTSTVDYLDVTFSFTTDAEGNYVVEVPGAVTSMNAESDLGYTFTSVAYAADADFVANEDRVLVAVVNSDTLEEIEDVNVFGAKTESKFFIYKAVTDESGVAMFDAVNASSFYVYIPAYNVEYAFDSNGSAITAGTNTTYKLAGYAIQFGVLAKADLVTYELYVNGELIRDDIAKGDAVVVSIENGEDGAVLKVVTTTDGTYATTINSTTFKYWELSDGTTSTNAQIAFVAGYDGVKTVGDSNAYAFTAVFEQSQGDIIPAYPEEKGQSVDPTILVLGIAAVIVALIAVVYAVIQKKE